MSAIIRSRALITFALYAWCMSVSVSQQPNFRVTHYTTSEGLSQNYVYCILQDSKGFLWFGTRNGLNKYDGYSFTHYFHEPFEENCLPHNIVMSVVEDREGYLWIGTNGGGLSRFDRRTEEFIHFHHNPNDPQSISSDFIYTLYLARDGVLWIGTNGGGLNRFTITEFNRRYAKDRSALPPEFMRFDVHETTSTASSDEAIHSIAEDLDGNLWMATNYRLVRYHPSTGRWMQYLTRTESDIAFADSTMQNRSRGGSGRLNIITTEHGLVLHPCGGVFLFDRGKNFFRKVNDQFIDMLFEDNHQRIWGGQRGLWLMMQGEWKGYPVPLATADRIGGDGPSVHCMVQDRHGSIWVGSSIGIFKLQENASGFSFLQPVSRADGKNQPIEIRAIMEGPNGELLLGTVDDWIYRYDGNAIIRWDVRRIRRKQPRAGERTVNAILKIRKERYLIASAIGMYEWDAARGVRKVYGYRWLKRHMESHSNSFALLRDSNDRFWMGGAAKRKGVFYRFDVIGDSLIPLHDNINAAHDFNCGSGVWKIIETKDGELWIGTTNGLFHFHPDDRSFMHYKHNPVDTTSLSENEIWTIHESGDGTMWIGTLGGGLNAFDRATGKFRSFTNKHGLGNNYVCCILEDEHGQLWMSTNNSVSKFDPATKSFTNYYTSAVQSTGGFSFGSGLRMRDGRMCFGGMKGLLVFHPDSIRQSQFAAPLVITSCEVLGKKRSGELANNDTLVLRHDENHLSFEFASLDFSNTMNNRYAYILHGAEGTWIDCGTRRSCTYSNLEPGDYVFRVKGTNSDGVWNEKGISIVVRIVPPVHRTQWFRWSATLVLVAFLSTLVITWHRQARKKERTERKMIESELRALRLQMNPHFIFNSLNAIQNFVLEADVRNANEYLAKFARLMRMILENSKQPAIRLKDEIDFLRMYLEIESLRFHGSFQFMIDVDPQLDDDTAIPSMLLQPYVENALRHGLSHKGSKGTLRIALEKLDSVILASVEDDGIGRARSQEMQQGRHSRYASMGMEITQDRLNILNQARKKNMSMKIIDLVDEQRAPAGTRIEIVIPIE